MRGTQQQLGPIREDGEQIAEPAGASAPAVGNDATKSVTIANVALAL